MGKIARVKELKRKGRRGRERKEGGKRGGKKEEGRGKEKRGRSSVGEFGATIDPDIDCGLTGITAVSVSGCVNSGQLLAKDDGQEYLTGDIYGCAAVSVGVSE